MAVHGMGGLGKTMLVEELVRRLGPRYPGGVLFEHRGEHPPDVQDVLHRWASYAVGGSAPGGVIRPADVRAMFAGAGELLVVIDDIWPNDFRAAKQLLEALPVDAERILTTRFADGAKALGARLYSLRTMTQSDGMQMLFDRLAANGPPPSKNLVRRLHRIVGGHALALELAAGRCKDTSRLPTQVNRLEERIRAGDLSKVAMGVPGLGRDVSLQVSLEESISALQDADAQNGTQLAERLMMLGVFAEEAPFDCEAAAAVWGDDDPEDAERRSTRWKGTRWSRPSAGASSSTSSCAPTSWGCWGSTRPRRRWQRRATRPISCGSQAASSRSAGAKRRRKAPTSPTGPSACVMRWAIT
ncbi:MAG: hypothetical protein P8Z40_17070 [Chloroflexota bacterium]